MSMRNDANDDFDNVPSLRADSFDHDDFHTAGPTRVQARSVPAVQVKGPSTGPLWALVGALFFAFIGLAWWSFQQISLMEQQLVATQESFARISEEAAGRLQDISGKVVASQTNVSSDSEALKLQIKQLESQLLEQGQQQQGVVGQATDLDKRLAQIAAQSAEQRTLNSQLQSELKTLGAEVTTLKSTPADTSKVEAELKSLSVEIAALKKQGNPSAAIDRLEQELLVIKSEQDNRPTTPQGGATVAEFDAFRGQVTRNITTLQTQIRNLQQQISTRP